MRFAFANRIKWLGPFAGVAALSIGLGLGALLIGRLSDHFASRYGSEALRHAILSGMGFYLISAALFLLASRHLAREWQN